MVATEAPMARLEGANLARISWLGRVFARIVYGATRRRVGKVIFPVQLRAWSPWTLFGYGMMETSVERARTADVKLKNLAAVRVGTLVGCPF